MRETGEGLEPLFRRLFPGRRFVVVSNREPYEHRWSDEVGEVDVRRPAGGLTSALDPLLQALGGTWVAWGSGEADAALLDREHRVRVPPEEPRYALRLAHPARRPPLLPGLRQPASLAPLPPAPGRTSPGCARATGSATGA